MPWQAGPRKCAWNDQGAGQHCKETRDDRAPPQTRLRDALAAAAVVRVPISCSPNRPTTVARDYASIRRLAVTRLAETQVGACKSLKASKTARCVRQTGCVRSD